MDNNNTTSKTNEEIDLTRFFAWIGRGFKRAGNGVLYVLSSLRNLFVSNLIFFMVTIVIGIALGTVYIKLIRKKEYRSSMVLSCSYLNNHIVNNTIEKLNLLCEGPENEGLGAELGISDSLAKNIISFEFEPFISEKEVVEMEVLKEQLNNVVAEKKDLVQRVVSKLSIENRDAYQISVVLLTPTIVDELEQALISYFQNSPYIKKRIEIAAKGRLQRREKLVRESEKLDSLKLAVFNYYESQTKSSKGSNNVILNDDKINTPLDVFKEDLLINQEILALDHDIYVRPDFELIDGFTGFTHSQSASLSKVLVISFFLSILAGYVVLLGFEFDRILASYSTDVK
jgi:hypothetical protein